MTLIHVVYMLGTKYEFMQSMDCAAQTMDRTLCGQSMDCAYRYTYIRPIFKFYIYIYIYIYIYFFFTCIFNLISFLNPCTYMACINHIFLICIQIS